MRQLALEKGQKVRLSQKGHRDFLYPSQQIETLAENTQCEQLPYVGGRPWIAVKIPASSIYTTQATKQYLVVWVEEKMLYGN